MGAVRALVWALVLLCAPPAAASPIDRWRPLIEEASLRFGVPEAWIVRVMHAESGGRTRLDGQPITSRAGAMGLMQVMPATYAAMAREHGLGPDPHDPRDNILAGTAYLRAMHDLFGHPGLFAAYNAGPARYAQHLRSGRPLPRETRHYVGLVAGGDAEPWVAGSPGIQSRQSGLFIAIGAPAPRHAAAGLFIRLRGDP